MLISLCYFHLWMAASYIKILKSSGNFTNVFRGTYKSPWMAASISCMVGREVWGSSSNLGPSSDSELQGTSLSIS